MPPADNSFLLFDNFVDEVISKESVRAFYLLTKTLYINQASMQSGFLIIDDNFLLRVQLRLCPVQTQGLGDQ